MTVTRASGDSAARQARQAQEAGAAQQAGAPAAPAAAPQAGSPGGAPRVADQFTAAKAEGPTLTKSQEKALQAATSGPGAGEARQQAASAEVAAFRSIGMPMTANAEREMGPLPPTQRVPITDQDQRVHLARNSSQVNPVSQKAGNDGLICGGAAAANALVLSCKTPEACTANAKAVNEACTHLGVTPTPRQQQAIDQMGKGQLSREDVQHMQQLLYNMGKRSGVPEGGDPDGVGPKQMFALAGHLKAAGGFPGSEVSFHQNQTKIDGKDTLHWTVSVDNLHSNSVHPSAQHQDKSLVLGGAPPDDLTKKGGRWGAEVRIGDKEVVADFRTGDKPNSYVTMKADVGQLKNASTSGNEQTPSRGQILYNFMSRFEKEGGRIVYKPTEG